MPDLRRRRRIERSSGHARGLALKSIETLGEGLRQAVQFAHIDPRALMLHRRQHGHQRKFYIVEQLGLALFIHFLSQQWHEPQGRFGGLCSLCGNGAPVGDRAVAVFTGGIVSVDNSAEVSHCQRGDIVLTFRIAQIMSHRRIEICGPREFHIYLRQKEHEALDVGTDDAHLRVSEKRLQQLRQSGKRPRQICAAVVGAEICQGDAGRLSGHGVGIEVGERHAHVAGGDGAAYELRGSLGAVYNLCLRHHVEHGGLLGIGKIEQRGCGGGGRRRNGAGIRRRGIAAYQALEIEFAENFHQRIDVGLSPHKVGGTHTHGNVGAYCHQPFGVAYALGIGLYLGTERTFDLVGMREHFLDTAELRYELDGSFLTDTRAARHIVRSVALEGQQVYDLTRRCYAVTLAHLLRPADLETLTFERWTVHQYVVGHELAVVLVRSHHVGGETFLGGVCGEGSYYIVGLVALHLHHGYAVGCQYSFYIRNCQGYVLGLFVASSLVLGVFLVSEGLAAGRVEAHGYIAGIFLAEHLLQSVDKTEHRRSVEPLRI